MRTRTLLAASCFGLLGLQITPADAAPDIVPHQAIYEMTLGDIRAGADINDVQGRMLFRWSDACEGWEVEQRYVLEFIYAEGESIALSSTYETWEAKDGSAFNFSYKTETNGQADEDIQGVASLPGGEITGTARYRLPDRVTEDLPAQTFFPSAHTVELIENAVDGVRFFTAHMFDGTDVQTAVELSAVIGRPVDVPTENADSESAGEGAVSLTLTSGRSWPVRLAFFSVDEQISEPEYEMSMRVFENGVVDELIIDYGDFQVLGRLATVEAISDGGC